MISSCLDIHKKTDSNLCTSRFWTTRQIEGGSRIFGSCSGAFCYGWAMDWLINSHNLLAHTIILWKRCR